MKSQHEFLQFAITVLSTTDVPQTVYTLYEHGAYCTVGVLLHAVGVSDLELEALGEKEGSCFRERLALAFRDYGAYSVSPHLIQWFLERNDCDGLTFPEIAARLHTHQAVLSRSGEAHVD